MKKLIFIGLLFLCGNAFAALSIGDLMTISTDTRFQSRCNYYLNQASVSVMTESAGTASHAARVVYAKNVIQNGISTKILAYQVLTNTTIASEATLTGPDFAIPDSDIQFVINTLYNALAGVSN